MCFLFKQKTAYEMRISDWSSDVCSSDLAPTDTVTSNSADEDTPWAAAELLPEMRAEAVVADGLISGLGAHNPKGHAACAMVAFEALAESDVEIGRAHV